MSSPLYDTDILGWSEQQAALLRQAAVGKPVPEIDWSNIIEEIEGVGLSELRAVESLLFQALVHMLKAEGWPLSRDTEHWRGEMRGFRRQARRRFTTSMRQKLDLAGLYDDAMQAVPATVDGQPPLPLPARCSMTLDELLGD